MTHVIIPNRPTPKDNRDITGILANFDAITNVINGQLGGDNIENEGITGAKLGSETMRLLNGATYSALTVRNEGVAYEPSPTRPTFVILEARITSAILATIELSLPGVGVIGPTVIGEPYIAMLPFIIPAKGTWSVKTFKAAAAVYKSSYITL